MCSSRERLAEAAEIIQAFIDQEVDYMTRNLLGDPEKQHNVIWGRRWLAANQPEKADVK